MTPVPRAGRRMALVGTAEYNRSMRGFIGSHIPTRTSRRRFVMTILVGMVSAFGCASRNDAVTRRKSEPLISTEVSPFTRSSPTLRQSSGVTPAPRPMVLEAYFDVLQVAVPRGALSESGKMWNHLDEAVLPPEVVTQLRRNGFRIGLGRPASWAPIKAILDTTEGATSSQQSLSFRNPHPLFLELDEQARDQTLFLYRADGTMRGKSYPNTRNRIRIAHAMNRDQMDEADVQIVPEVHQAEPSRRFHSTPNGYEMVPYFPTWVFAELAARLIVPPDYFIVIGPSEAAAQSLLVGTAFLTGEIDDRPVETLLVVTPKLLRPDRAAR